MKDIPYTFKMPPRIGKAPTVLSEAVSRVIKHRDAHIEGLLRLAGPGHAVGYRMKPADYRPKDHLFDPVLQIEWEFLTVALVEGALPPKRADYSWVTLKDWT